MQPINCIHGILETGTERRVIVKGFSSCVASCQKVDGTGKKQCYYVMTYLQQDCFIMSSWHSTFGNEYQYFKHNLHSYGLIAYIYPDTQTGLLTRVRTFTSLPIICNIQCTCSFANSNEIWHILCSLIRTNSTLTCVLSGQEVDHLLQFQSW